jgi:hypothetical protein
VSYARRVAHRATSRPLKFASRTKGISAGGSFEVVFPSGVRAGSCSAAAQAAAPINLGRRMRS